MCLKGRLGDQREGLGDQRVDLCDSEDDLGLGLTNIFKIKKIYISSLLSGDSKEGVRTINKKD